MLITEEMIDKRDFIKKKLKLKGFTQKEIADKLGVHKTLVNSVIGGWGKSAKVEQYINQLIGEEVF